MTITTVPWRRTVKLVPAVLVGFLTSAAQVEQAIDRLVHVADVIPPSPAGSSSVDALAFTASVVTGVEWQLTTRTVAVTTPMSDMLALNTNSHHPPPDATGMFDTAIVDSVVPSPTLRVGVSSAKVTLVFSVAQLVSSTTTPPPVRAVPTSTTLVTPDARTTSPPANTAIEADALANAEDEPPRESTTVT